jgi:LacI family transcriptional regulator
MKRPTMGDVAARAGVSKTTVSHVINDTRHVEEDTKQRVLQAVDDLGYRPSAAARSLTTNRTEVIGVIVSDSSNYFFAEVLRGIEDVLRLKNYALLVCNTAEILEREEHYLDILIRQRVDGIIAAATSRKWETLNELEALHIPIVFVDRLFEGLNAPYVGVANKKGASLGASYLIECGHSGIGILAGFGRLSTMRERLEGFKEALQKHDIPLPEEWVVPSPLTIQGGRDAMKQLFNLPHRPTAVFINNNLLALGALLALKDLGLRCPQDVALVGFDDHPWAAVSDPPLTVVRQPAEQIGRTAAEILLTLLKGEQADETNVWLECELVERQSCCPPSA